MVICNSITDMNVYTIGFTGKSAEKFFSLLRGEEIRRMIDVRLNNKSQLAGFSKMADLKFFLQELCAMEYVHIPSLAPTDELLKAYKKKHIPWEEYERKFLDLMDMRSIDEKIEPSLFQNGCLLCSEHKPHHCHRRLVVEYLNDRWGSSLKVKHLA